MIDSWNAWRWKEIYQIKCEPPEINNWEMEDALAGRLEAVDIHFERPCLPWRMHCHFETKVITGVMYEDSCHFNLYDHNSKRSDWNHEASETKGERIRSIQRDQSSSHRKAQTAKQYSQYPGYHPDFSQSIITRREHSWSWWDFSRRMMFFLCKSPWVNVALWPLKIKGKHLRRYSAL